jgi:hypothetical protein
MSSRCSTAPRCPGYRAPTDTIAPASRVPNLLFGIVRNAHRCGQLALALPEPALPAGLDDDIRLLANTQNLAELPPAVLARAITAWTQLIGGVSLELFGSPARDVPGRRRLLQPRSRADG